MKHKFEDGLNQIIALALQEQRKGILKSALQILDSEMELYGTDKHGLSREQIISLLK